MSQLRIEPIQEPDLDSVGEFLHDNLNRQITARDWAQSVRHPWCESRPNFGVQLRDGERLVGVFLAIYSDQTIDGRTERFCNPNSWCVINEYRTHGIGLLLSLLKQREFHFTMMTPNPKVATIFRGLRFRDLADQILLFPNLPSPRSVLSGCFAVSDLRLIAANLRDAARRDYELHCDLPWLKFVAFGRGQDVCLIAYKAGRWKRLPCARLLYVSDPESFNRQHGLLQHHLLTRRGLVVSQIEMRFLTRAPHLSYRTRRLQPKLFLSPTLKDYQIHDLYTELAALDV